LADFVTDDLRAAMDTEKTRINVTTTGHMSRMAIPTVSGSDEDVVSAIAKQHGEQRWLFIPNTLHLGTLYVSEDLRAEIEAHPACEICGEPTELTFDATGRHQLDFDS